MNIRVSRTVVEARASQAGDDRVERPIEDYAKCSAFVLLGEAGAGKSTEFRQVAKETKDGCYLTARNFLALAVRPEWRNRTLFIDALDERRAGSQDRLAPLDEIRSKLDQLGRPRFRISCRSVDWLGLNDQLHLSEASRDGKVKILHLNPLADRDVMEILRGLNLIPAPQEFVQAADEYGVGALLRNPLTLQLLAKSVAEQDWPRTRTEVYLRASRMLVTEHNEEHQLGARIPFSAEQKLHTAGRLLAVKILTGADGYSISANGGESCINSGDAQVDDPNLARAVLHSGLFKQGAPGQYIAYHTAIAEFLAGRFLASEVGEGLPVGRIHSLMAGYDGVILPQFRGIAAWIATHSPVCRRELVSADPIGAMLDGDVAAFPVDDRIHVLESINTKSKDNPWFILNVQSNDPRFGSLASADMAEYYARNLGSPSRTDSHQVHTYFLLNVLKHGSPISEMSDAVLRVVEDDTWRPKVRIEALRVLVGLPPSDTRRQEILLNLWHRVNSGQVADYDDEMQGILLRHLYPTVIGPGQILDHLHWPKQADLIGSYQAFWNIFIAKQSTKSQLVVLMDRLADRIPEISQLLQIRMVGTNPFSNFLPSIATRTILEFGDEVAPNRLFRWLAALVYPALSVPLEFREQVRAWLSSRRDLAGQVFECCIDHCLEQPSFVDCLSKIEFELGLDSSSEYGQICMSAAARVESSEAAAVLKGRASNFLPGNSAEIAHGVMRHASPASALEHPVSAGHREEQPVDLAWWQDPFEEAYRRKEYEEFKTHENSLRENRCDPATLFRLARVYFGEPPETWGGSPDTRLRASLLDDDDLIEAARFGLRNSVSRQDLPSVDEFAQMFDEGKTHYFALPVLAGIEEIGRESSVQPCSGENFCKRLALMLHFGVPRMNPDPWQNNSAAGAARAPAWYSRLARNEPRLVAREFVRSARSRLRSGTGLMQHIDSLYLEPNRSTIAPIVTARILRVFPVRSGTAQLDALANLLALAQRHCAAKDFEALVQQKLQSRSMAVAQRVYWLTAAFLSVPTRYRSTFMDVVGASQPRIRHLADFLRHSFAVQTPQTLLGSLDATDLAYLIRVLGSSYGPDRYGFGAVSENDPRASRARYVDYFMKELIERLGNHTSQVATEELERARTDESLRPWWFWLGGAADAQRAIRREAEFSYSSADAVCRVLAGREPANSADLAALTADTLVKLAERIRKGNTSDWKQYWTRAGQMSEWRPLNENDCRDALLSDLRGALSNLGIDCQPEPNCLDGRRGDMRVAFSDFGVPIEIKKSNHRSVWSSIQSQLIPNYTQDPECDGCGIYVVCWFGRDFLQPPLSGRKPSGPEQMREMLVASLEEDKQRKIGVVVVDVSRDQAAAR